MVTSIIGGGMDLWIASNSESIAWWNSTETLLHKERRYI
jgi:hypothetical protein